MPLPAIGLPISLLDIKTEFGGDAYPLGINEYYQNAVPSYTSGVAGIPNVNAIISLGMFHGKSKPVPSPIATAAVESSRLLLGAPWAFGQTNFEWLTGASGTNLTRSGGSTFNNIGTYARYRVNDANNQTLILQAKPGDALSFVLNNGATASGYTEFHALHLHLGSGWFLVQSVQGSGGFTNLPINYTLSASLAPGNYGIYAYNNYGVAGATDYASGNFYSLHVVA